MITITSKSRYAVRALTELARLGGLSGGRPVPIAELARRRDIPLQFLEQLDGELGADVTAEGSDQQDVWVKAVAALREVFGGTTIGEVAQREAEAAGARMYYI